LWPAPVIESVLIGLVVPIPTLPLSAKVVLAITEVDDANMPPNAEIGVEVADVLTAKF